MLLEWNSFICRGVTMYVVEYYAVLCLVAQSCPTLCDPMDYSLPGPSVLPGDFPRKNTGVGSCSFLQGISPTQGSNPGLPYCRQILYQLSRKESISVVVHIPPHNLNSSLRFFWAFHMTYSPYKLN